MKRMLEWLGGSVLVYAGIAACSGAGNALSDTGQDARTPDSETASQGGSGGSVRDHGSGGSGASDGMGGSPSDAGLMDVLTDAVDPVPDAMAQTGSGGDGGSGGSGGGATVCDCPEPEPPPEAEVVTAECETTTPGTGYALLEFPDKSVAELTRALVWLEPVGDEINIAGNAYDRLVQHVFWVSEGAITVQCSSDFSATAVL